MFTVTKRKDNTFVPYIQLDSDLYRVVIRGNDGTFRDYELNIDIECRPKKMYLPCLGRSLGKPRITLEHVAPDFDYDCARELMENIPVAIEASKELEEFIKTLQ